MSSVLLSLSLCMLTVAHVMMPLIHDYIERSRLVIMSRGADILNRKSSENELCNIMATNNTLQKLNVHWQKHSISS